MDNIKNDLYFTKRILKSIETLTRYMKDKSLDDLFNDGFLLDAIENRFTKIAEDASNLTKEYKASTPEIPWSAISTIRNKVCHDYDVVDAGSLHKTIKFNFPDFKSNLLKHVNCHYMNLNDKPFKLIEAKHKKVEMRLNDEKRQFMKIGDLILLKNTLYSNELLVEILNIKRFSTFDELYSQYKKADLGYLENEIANPDDMLTYYSEENIKQYGVLAIEIRLY